MTDVRVTKGVDFAELGTRWRDLEARADCSFFQTWTWVGCLAPERFTDPVLVEAAENGRTVALALFNRTRRGMLYLSESGSAALDCPYVEQNGVLAETGRAEELTVACLRAVAARHVVVMSGVGETTLRAARDAAGLVWSWRSQVSPFVDLEALRHSGVDYLTERSANTRQQIRRSDRFYGRNGTIETKRAETVAEAWAMLDAMGVLHQATWTARGKPGSFAEPFFRRFHLALIEAAAPRDEVLLLRVSCQEAVVGILYGFSFRGRMLAYQSGFDYGVEDRQAKPGLTCHHAAIRYSLAQGFKIYDFLAGEDRYKRSLGDRDYTQNWMEAGPSWSPRLLVRRADMLLGGSLARVVKPMRRLRIGECARRADVAQARPKLS